MGTKNQLAKQAEMNRKLMMDMQRLFTTQYCSDLMAIMLHREFGFGKERCNRALEAFGKLHDEFIIDALEDDKADRNLTAIKANIDNLLREIFSDETPPWKERYWFTYSKRKK